MSKWHVSVGLLDAAAAADMLAWENSGFSVDASVRITVVDRDVPSYFFGVSNIFSDTAPGPPSRWTDSP